MTFHDETSARPSLFERLFVARDSRVARAPRPREVSVVWGLAALQLGLSALLAALYGTWFAWLVLVLHALVCASWVHLARERSHHLAMLERRTLRAEEGTAAKSALLATMSHELRSPLNGILGMSSLLSRTALNMRQAELVATLQRCADNLLVMVNDALDFARLEAGKLPIESTAFELRNAVDEVLAMNGFRAQEKGIELYAVVERSVPDCVVGDVTRIRQALTNLVTNAVKFTEVGEVEVRVSAKGPGRIRFSVSDTGIGIEPAARTRLFTPFGQANGNISRRYGGSGLGLAISRRLVLTMNGSIDFESTPGIGSRFYFELPLRPPPARERKSVLSGTEGRQVAIVTPHGGLREGLVEACSRLGLETRCADNVALLGEPFDVAIIDGGLPKSQLEGLATHAARARMLLIARSNLTTPGWMDDRESSPSPALSWPVRQGALLSQLTALLVGAEESEDARRSRLCQLGTGRVLVVEDTPVNQLVAQALLAELGLASDVASDGKEALQRLAQEPFDLVLMDCQLPELSGFETTRCLRAEAGPNQRTPVIALTANAMSGDEEACRGAGMDDYMVKPIERAVLIAKLERWLTRSRESATSNTALIHPCISESSDEPGRVSYGDVDELDSFMRDFEAHVGRATAQRLASVYRESVPEVLRRLRSALEPHDTVDFANLKGAAHALRGTLRSMGLRNLAERLHALEKPDESVARETLEGLVSEIEARALVVHDALKGSDALREITRRRQNREVVG